MRDWLMNEERRRTVVQLLNNEVATLGQKLGLLTDREKMYYPCEGLKRTKAWRPRFRERSERIVAQRMYAYQLGRPIWVHPAVIARFQSLKDRIFLRLTPTFLITEDGVRAIFGPKEGTIITRLTNRTRNQGYLNSLLFWSAVLSEGSDRGEIALAGGKIMIPARPVGSTIDMGILSDRPIAEKKMSHDSVLEEDAIQ